ncbi:MAG: serine/threonine protein kinase [Labilithrix sp.]|nr:serine/threonine protein kinase [Labilithrix sp.]MCW5811357.1 serine/threonine protein kinase [Labilithrix sp.]
MSNASVKPGDVLAGKYRVEKVLGAGGMGYVVAARHLQLDQLVAMKFLRKGAIENTEASARFLREAKAVVKLKNEHVAKVYDVGTLEGGEPYIVMEYLDGADLSAMAKERHVLPVPEAAEYVLQACEALAEAHSLGIIHRDIKLANIFVTRGPAGSPLVKVLDFGISKTNPFGESEHDMTRTASMLGSPRFMSPEQMRDPRAVDGRTDIWSLGVVLYRLVAGRPPFEADTLGRLLTMVMHEQEMPLSSVRKDLPPGFSEIVAHCLQKDPAVRFASVADLARELAPYCVEPERARASADRIAAVVAMPHSNRSDVSHPLVAPITGPTGPNLPPIQPRMASMHSVRSTGRNTGRNSHPPGASDTGGTASPWASGTHSALKPRGHMTTIIAALGLAVLLVGSLTFAKVRQANNLREREEAAARAAMAAAAAAPPPVLTTAPIAPVLPPPAIAPAPTAPEVLPTATPTTPAAPATGVPKAEPPPRRPQPAPRPASRPAPAPRPSPAPKSGEDIPTTRD